MAPNRDMPAAADVEFESFFRRVYPQLSRALYLILSDQRLAEDVAQEAFVTTLRHWTRVAAMESPEGFVYQVAFNLGRKAQKTYRLTAVDIGATDIPERTPDQADLRIEIHNALRALPPEQREALVLVDWLGIDSKAAAELLEIAPSSVRGRVHRARRTLRRTLGHWRSTTEVK